MFNLSSELSMACDRHRNGVWFGIDMAVSQVFWPPTKHRSSPVSLNSTTQPTNVCERANTRHSACAKERTAAEKARVLALNG